MKDEDHAVKFLKSTLVCLFLFLTANSIANAASLSQSANNILYVKAIPSGSADCSNWDNACGLQDALDRAVSGHQIWVAKGTYKPTKPISSIYPKNSPTFNLETGVAIYGGFPDSGGEWGDRDPAAQLTVLSGELGLPDDDYDNSFHVVTARRVDDSATLDGFTISNGKATGSVGGGGLYIDRGSPTLNNLIFTENIAGRFGGGGMKSEYGSPKLTNVTFIDNYAYLGGGGFACLGGSPELTNVSFIGNEAENYGGGIYTYDECNLILTHVSFNENTARFGGGMADANSPSILHNVTFSGNTAERGGGMFNYNNGSPNLTNITFSGNTAVTGGGMYTANYCYPSLTNVTFSYNSAETGGGMFTETSSIGSMTNSILWGNTPDQVIGPTAISYSDVQGDSIYVGAGNINSDPNLKPQADNGGFTQTHALGAGSPAIDAAIPDYCPATDQRGYLRPIDGNNDGVAVCDMGAFELGYRLTVNVEGIGSVDINTEKLDYMPSEAVTLIANAAEDWAFTGWLGDFTGSEGQVAVTIDRDMAITAVFTQILFRYILVPIFK